MSSCSAASCGDNPASIRPLKALAHAGEIAKPASELNESSKSGASSLLRSSDSTIRASGCKVSLSNRRKTSRERVPSPFDRPASTGSTPHAAKTATALESCSAAKHRIGCRAEPSLLPIA